MEGLSWGISGDKFSTIVDVDVILAEVRQRRERASITLANPALSPSKEGPASDDEDQNSDASEPCFIDERCAAKRIQTLQRRCSHRSTESIDSIGTQSSDSLSNSSMDDNDCLSRTECSPLLTRNARSSQDKGVRLPRVTFDLPNDANSSNAIAPVKSQAKESSVISTAERQMELLDALFDRAFCARGKASQTMTSVLDGLEKELERHAKAQQQSASQIRDISNHKDSEIGNKSSTSTQQIHDCIWSDKIRRKVLPAKPRPGSVRYRHKKVAHPDRREAFTR